MGVGCRSSGLITSDGTIVSGRCKLVSIHGFNQAVNAAGVPGTTGIKLVLYDNASAASGKVVAQLVVGVSEQAISGAGTPNSIESDMHSVICENGLYANVTIPTGVVGTTGNLSGFTVEFA